MLNCAHKGGSMKETYILKGLNCPNCAAKIEREILSADGVKSAGLNLVRQTLDIEFEGVSAEDMLSSVEKTVHSHEPEVEVSAKHKEHVHDHDHSHDENGRGRLIRLLVGAAVFAVGIALMLISGVHPAVEIAVLVVSYIILGGDVVLNALKNIAKGRIFDENFLMSLSSIGAFIIGEHHEAVAVMLFYQVGEYFQDMAVGRSRRSINELMDIRPDSATVKRENGIFTVSPEEIAVGEAIIVKPGERIALDGIVIEGESTLDTKALTGESLPRAVSVGDEVLSGCINQGGLLLIIVTKPYGESTVSKIIDLVENASSRKAPTESFITKFARYYTPAVVILAAMLAIIPPLAFDGGWADWIHRAFVFLVVSCPCALVISVPLAYFGGIGAASKHGILIKGGNFLEALNSVELVAFDKTGTLTKGVFKVTELSTENGYTRESLLEYAALAESFSTHPIAKSIVSEYGKDIDKATLSDYTEFSGKGISVRQENKVITVGNAALMEENGISFVPCGKVGTKVYVAVDDIYVGYIIIADEIKPDAKISLEKLKNAGIKKTVMLTGDDASIAKDVAERLGVDEYYSQLLPNEKVEIFESLDKSKDNGSKTVFVGDGINDAPVLARADIGIAMGGLGSDAAIEAADVVLMTDEIGKLAEAIELSRETKRIVIQNIVFALGVKGVFLVLGAFGIAGMWEAVFGDVGVALLAVFNSMRILKK